MQKDILKQVGLRIRDLRKERGWSQEALGERGGFHYSYIGQIERGEKNISLLNLVKIAEALEVSVPQLFAYLEDGGKVSGSEADLQEIVRTLRTKKPQQVRIARNIVRELVSDTYEA